MKIFYLVSIGLFLAACSDSPESKVTDQNSATSAGENGLDGARGQDGANGRDGVSCSVASLGDSSGARISCGETAVDILNGTNGTNGAPGLPGAPGAPGAIRTITHSTPSISGGTIIDSALAITNGISASYRNNTGKNIFLSGSFFPRFTNQPDALFRTASIFVEILNAGGTRIHTQYFGGNYSGLNPAATEYQSIQFFMAPGEQINISVSMSYSRADGSASFSNIGNVALNYFRVTELN